MMNLECRAAKKKKKSVVNVTGTATWVYRVESKGEGTGT